MINIRAFLGIALILARSAKAYPSKYPFENESLVPPGVNAATPSLTYDDEDPGGYLYSYAYSRTDFEQPSCQYLGVIAHMQASYDVTPFPPVGFHNCSAKGYDVIGPTSFLNTFAGVKMCEEGECCKESYGQRAFYSPEVGPEDYDWEGGLIIDGACDGVYQYEVFCSIFDRYHSVMCWEYNLSDMERTIMHPCYDGIFQFYMSCALYKSTGFQWDAFLEPASYWESSTGEEMNAHAAVFRKPDKVCQPYSYYYPETAKSSGDSADGISSSDEASESKSSAPSSSAAENYGATVVLFALAAFA